MSTLPTYFNLRVRHPTISATLAPRIILACCQDNPCFSRPSRAAPELMPRSCQALIGAPYDQYMDRGEQRGAAATDRLLTCKNMFWFPIYSNLHLLLLRSTRLLFGRHGVNMENACVLVPNRGKSATCCQQRRSKRRINAE